MNERFKTYWRKKWLLSALVLALLMVLSIVLLVLGRRAVSGADGEQLGAGLAYLEALEQKDMAAIERKVRQVEKEARAQAIANGELSVWAQFQDYVIFGDSRTVGFYFYEFLDTNRVLADGGLTIADIPAYVDRMAALDPAYLFLCTGLNDVSIGYWNTPEEYVAAYEETVQMLKSRLPNTHIYINSIFPAQDPAFQESEAWRRIPEYNGAIQAWCEERGYSYIDNTPVFQEHSDLYDADGIHFQKEFYEYWAVNMLAEVV
ncbi:MAG: GDSL-type esterase/lipase family protein [Eubacteriales bacterium]|nr:GDSL-type esterase/lipase family protein [Eubacteriales bacterium]